MMWLCTTGTVFDDDDENKAVGGVFEDILRDYSEQCDAMEVALVRGAMDAVTPLFEVFRREKCVLWSACVSSLVWCNACVSYMLCPLLPVFLILVSMCIVFGLVQ